MAKVDVDRHNARNDRVASALAAYTAGKAAPPARSGRDKGVRSRALAQPGGGVTLLSCPPVMSLYT
jgi:hypothetical protein